MIYVEDAEEKRIEEIKKKVRDLREEFDDKFVRLETDLKPFDYVNSPLSRKDKRTIVITKGSYIRIKAIYLDSDKIEVDFQVPLDDKQMFEGKKYFYLWDKTPDDIEKWFRETFSTTGRTSKADWSYDLASELHEYLNDKKHRKFMKKGGIIWTSFFMSLFTYLLTLEVTIKGVKEEPILPKFFQMPSLILTILTGVVGVGLGVYLHHIKKGVYREYSCFSDDREYWERDRKIHRRYEKATGNDVDELTDYDMINAYIQLLESDATEDYIYHFNPLEKFGLQTDKQSAKSEKEETRDKKKDNQKEETSDTPTPTPKLVEKPKDAFTETSPCETNGGEEAKIFNGVWEEYPMGLELFRTVNDKKGA